jgi:hypothetical protein
MIDTDPRVCQKLSFWSDKLTTEVWYGKKWRTDVLAVIKETVYRIDAQNGWPSVQTGILNDTMDQVN